jgi:hypothetical protein
MQPARHRAASMTVAALFAAALFAAAPLAFGASAHADGPVRDGGSSVTFSGAGLLGVACTSTASASSLTVRAESSLRVVNETGHRATVLLGAAITGEIANGASADVLLHRVPVSLALKPSCLFADTSAVRVDVIGAPAVRQPAPPAANPAATPTVAGGPTSGSGGTGGRGGTRTNGSSGTGTGHDAAGAAPTNSAAQPDEQPGRARPRGGETSAAPGAGADITDEDPPASVEPVSETGGRGLLAMIATVCAVGVSVGAIRAITAQRATRTRGA